MVDDCVGELEHPWASLGAVTPDARPRNRQNTWYLNWEITNEVVSVVPTKLARTSAECYIWTLGSFRSSRTVNSSLAGRVI